MNRKARAVKYQSARDYEIATFASPILYISVVRSPALSALHREIWDGVRQTVPGAVAHYYHPEEWAPHVTLAQGDIDSDKLAEVVRYLCRRNFHWEFNVTKDRKSTRLN